MSYLTVNSVSCIRGRISLPLVGAWVADVVADPDSFPQPGAACTLALGSTNLSGVVRRANAPFGTTFARIIGGAGGLPTQLPPKGYQQTTVSAVLGDIMSACGEALAGNSDQTILSQQLASWVRIGAPGWSALAMLISTTGGAWRVLPNGQIWVGFDTYPPTTMESFELLGYEPQELRAEIYSDQPTILPGQSFLGGNVQAVEHSIEPDKIISRVLFRDDQLAKVENASA